MSKRDIQEKIFTDCDENEVEYKCVPFGASKGMSLVRPLIKILGGPLAGLVGAAQGGEMSTQAVLQGLDGLCDALEDVEKSKYIFKLLESVSRICPETGDVQKPSNKATFDQIYQANYLELLHVLAWVCQVNFTPSLRKQIEPLKKMWTKMKVKIEEEVVKKVAENPQPLKD